MHTNYALPLNLRSSYCSRGLELWFDMEVGIEGYFYSHTSLSIKSMCTVSEV